MCYRREKRIGNSGLIDMLDRVLDKSIVIDGGHRVLLAYQDAASIGYNFTVDWVEVRLEHVDDVYLDSLQRYFVNSYSSEVA